MEAGRRARDLAMSRSGEGGSAERRPRTQWTTEWSCYTAMSARCNSLVSTQDELDVGPSGTAAATACFRSTEGADARTQRSRRGLFISRASCTILCINEQQLGWRRRGHSNATVAAGVAAVATVLATASLAGSTRWRPSTRPTAVTPPATATVAANQHKELELLPSAPATHPCAITSSSSVRQVDARTTICDACPPCDDALRSRWLGDAFGR